MPAEGADDPEQMVTTLARGCVSGCEEGLAEFRAALRLDKSNYDYMLDYAEAMLHCQDVAGCTQQCTSLWEVRSKLSLAQAVRCASLLAATAREVMHAKEELRWLKELVGLDPQQEKAVQRLGELLAADPGVTWLPFEAGRAVAQTLNRPMLVHFTAAWCGWCRKLEQETYPNPKVVARLRQCVCVQVNGDRRRDLTSKYGVRGYPTTLVLHPSGHVLRTIVGYRPPDAYAAELDEALKITIE
jgi:thiol:disulfide interchange protein